jgi:hypothetical protein
MVSGSGACCAAIPIHCAGGRHCLGIAALFFPPAGLVLAGELILYVSIMILAGLRLAVAQKKAYLVPGLLLAIATMHISWGSGFLWSILTSSVQKHGR